MRTLSLMLLSTLALSAVAAEPTKTVGWYRNHPYDRAALLRICNDNPGELEQTPNCRNAARADGLEMAAKRGGIDFDKIRSYNYGRTPWRADNDVPLPYTNGAR